MRQSHSRFGSLLALLAVLGWQICACASMRATPTPAPENDPHACCKADPSQPAPVPQNDDCSECNHHQPGISPSHQTTFDFPALFPLTIESFEPSTLVLAPAIFPLDDRPIPIAPHDLVHLHCQLTT